MLPTRVPVQTFVPTPLRFSKDEQHQIRLELRRFLACNIIEPVTDHSADEYISNIFIRKKKNGGVRVILNLRSFNEQFIDKQHFKMETLRSAIEAMRPFSYLTKIDLSEAFYSIRLLESDRKYFRFLFDGIKYQFTALVMGQSKNFYQINETGFRFSALSRSCQYVFPR